MTSAGFEKICAANKLEAEEEEHISNRHFLRFNMCKECSGPPPELTIIELTGSVAAPAKKKTETLKKEEVPVAEKKEKQAICICESCGREAQKLYGNYGKKVCGVCQSIRGMAKKRPEILIATAREFGYEADQKVIIKNTPNVELEKELAAQKELVSKLKAHLQASKAIGTTPQNDTAVSNRCKDLALRLALGMLKGQNATVSADDIELLRSI